mgnify:CR=1 FL=1
MFRTRPAAPVAAGDGFRWRGTEVSRLEALSDAVFGFVLTLLVVSLEVPRTAGELLQTMRGFGAFAAAFALLFLVWFNQHRFFRRYGLQDTTPHVLNAALLFCIIFFAYPLKFIAGLVIALILGQPLAVSQPDGSTVPLFTSWAEAVATMNVFSTGYIAVWLVFALLHLHAFRLRRRLELSELEVYDTLDNVRESMINVTLGALSVLVALTTSAAFVGFVYWLVGPVMWAHGVWSGRRRTRLRARLAAVPAE